MAHMFRQKTGLAGAHPNLQTLARPDWPLATLGRRTAFRRGRAGPASARGGGSPRDSAGPLLQGRAGGSRRRRQLGREKDRRVGRKVHQALSRESTE